MDASQLGDMQRMLMAMTDADNTARQAAEDAYEKIEIGDRVGMLWCFFKAGDAYDGEARNLSLVLLRRTLSSSWEQFWPKWTADAQTNFKSDILLVTQNEATGDSAPAKLHRKRLADIIAEVASALNLKKSSKNLNLVNPNADEDSGRQTWAEVVNFIHSCATSDSDALKEIGLTIFESVPNVFGIDQSQYISAIKQMLSSCLTHSSAEIRSLAVRALTAFLCDNDEDAQVLKAFADTIPLVLKICHNVIETEADDDAALQCVGDLATNVPKVLRPHLNDICTLCLAAVGTQDKDASYRTSALEVLVSLCESAPAMMRKRGLQFIPAIVEQCLSMMSELEDDADWHTIDNTDDDSDQDDNSAEAEAALDRVAIALGGKTVLPAALHRVPAMMQSENWTVRHAAIMALSTIGEGCKKAMEPSIEQIVDSIVPFLKDEHPRVRYAACNALGQMCTDFAPTIQKKCHAKVVPGLLGALEDMNNPRVMAHAGAALVNFSEDCPKHILVTYLDALMGKLQGVLQHTFQQLLEQNKKLVLEQVITTIASIADTAEDRFVFFYDRMMPPLKYILTHATAPELRLLRGKCIECISLIGCAVGEAKFGEDAQEIMQMLLQSQQNMGELEPDDPQTSYMMSAWARICKLMGPRFAQYLPLVMPAVMRVAQHKPEIAVLDQEDVSDVQDNWEVVQLADSQSLGIKTAGMEEKATACEMLVCYCRELKGAFAEYVTPVAELMIPLLKFYFHDGIRTAAAEAMPCLLAAGKAKGGQFVVELWAEILPQLLKAAEAEFEIDVRAELLGSIAECVEELGEGCMDAARIDEVIKLLQKILEGHFEKCAEDDKRRQEEDHDEDAEEELKEELNAYQDVLGRTADVWHSLFKTHAALAVPYFEQFVPVIQKMWGAGRSPAERQWAICIVDDLIEFGAHHSLKHQEQFVPAMLSALDDTAPEVRQAAAYGIGVMAYYGENGYAGVCAQALPKLCSMIAHEDARKTQAASAATDNAISAVAKILKCNASMVDSNQVIPVFVGWLPTWEDEEEQPYIYGYLCDLVDNNQPSVVGGEQNVSRLVQVIAGALHKDALKHDSDLARDVRRRLLAIVAQLMNANATLFQACAAQLSDEERTALELALCQQPSTS